MKTGHVIQAMIGYYAGDIQRINHFIKVYGFAKAIGEMEGLDDEVLQILEIAALTHDIGIKNSENRHGSADGRYQEEEGPPEAKRILHEMNAGSALIDRVCWLIAHHHTYNDIKEIDHQILVEADFLVNANEGDMSSEAIRSVRDRIFKTAAGKDFLDIMYNLY